MNQDQKAAALLPYAQSVTDLKPVKDSWLGCCPVHNEKTPSFWVNPERGTAHCFGCGFHGDALDLYMELNGADFIEAKKALGLWDDSRSAPKFKPRIKPPDLLEYSDKNKRGVYSEAVKWLKLGHDVPISGHEKHRYASEFIASAAAKSGNADIYIVPIVEELRKNGQEIMADLLVNLTIKELD